VVNLGAAWPDFIYAQKSSVPHLEEQRWDRTFLVSDMIAVRVLFFLFSAGGQRWNKIRR